MALSAMDKFEQQMPAAPRIMGAAMGMLAPEQMQMELSPGLACLSQHNKIEVREKANWVEALTAIMGQEVEMPNRYNVFADGGRDELFFAAEQTNCCNRNLKQCFPDCAPWDLHVLYTHRGNQMKAFHVERPWTCTCCCFNRPIMTVTDAISGEKLGSLKDPFACCNYTFAVRDPADEVVLNANGNCCQCGLCCPCPCGPCAEVNFPITDARSGEKVGYVQKKVPGCCKFFLASDVDNYYVDFGGVQDPKYKALLMALAIFIDFRYFNENRADDQGGVAGAMSRGD
eukprot:TRINITY_DN50264_c0_g1_i1.p1 TRINITY_DN50264_c0_g1~~TRINITY_DN50264_c0_g1_i1.p1  ORF type:complete len:286 (+),score=74.16 TRINITY_DN50264_c0_g1_i1:112-969(+)